MLSFKEYISEHIVNSFDGSNRKELMDKHGDEMVSHLSKSYAYAGGYGGHGTGTPEEHHAIRSDLENPKHIIKATRRNGNISSVNIYKNQHGRKSIGAGTDGTETGKRDFIKNKKEDIGQKHRHSWAEVSDKAEHLMKKLGAPVVSNKHAEKLTGKHIIDKDENGEHYTRKIGDTPHKKVIVGNPKV